MVGDLVVWWVRGVAPTRVKFATNGQQMANARTVFVLMTGFTSANIVGVRGTDLTSTQTMAAKGKAKGKEKKGV